MQTSVLSEFQNVLKNQNLFQVLLLSLILAALSEAYFNPHCACLSGSYSQLEYQPWHCYFLIFAFLSHQAIWEQIIAYCFKFSPPPWPDKLLSSPNVIFPLKLFMHPFNKYLMLSAGCVHMKNTEEVILEFMKLYICVFVCVQGRGEEGLGRKQ